MAGPELARTARFHGRVFASRGVRDDREAPLALINTSDSQYSGSSSTFSWSRGFLRALLSAVVVREGRTEPRREAANRMLDAGGSGRTMAPPAMLSANSRARHGDTAEEPSLKLSSCSGCCRDLLSSLNGTATNEFSSSALAGLPWSAPVSRSCLSCCRAGPGLRSEVAATLKERAVGDKPSALGRLWPLFPVWSWKGKAQCCCQWIHSEIKKSTEKVHLQ